MQRYHYYASVLDGPRSINYATKSEALEWGRHRLSYDDRHINIYLRVGKVDHCLETLISTTVTMDTYRAVVVVGIEASLEGATTRIEATNWGLDRRVLEGAKVVDIYLRVRGKDHLIDRLLDPKVWQRS